jgi:ABC-type polysaccharide/polyol phosphate transport system ATPase subunit
MNEMVAKARIIVAASHDLDSLTQLCGQAIWLDHGRARMAGAISGIVAAYRKSMQKKLLSNADSPAAPLSPAA